MLVCAASGELRHGSLISFASLLAVLFSGADVAAASAQKSASGAAEHERRRGADQLSSSSGIAPSNATPADMPAVFPLQDVPTHPVKCHDSRCGGHGKCVDNSCICFPHYAGANCTVFIPTDVHVDCADPTCSGHGRCDVGLCRCDAGWTGSDCETQARCPQDCNSPSGSCVDGFCICEMGFAGAACDEVVCPNECWGHGTCVHGRCSCYDGWDGDECGEKLQEPVPAVSFVLARPASALAPSEVTSFNFDEGFTVVATPDASGERMSVPSSSADAVATETIKEDGAPKSLLLETQESTAVQQGLSRVSSGAQRADRSANADNPGMVRADSPMAQPTASPNLAKSVVASAAMKQVNAALGAAERAIAAAGALEVAGSQAMQQAEGAARQRRQQGVAQAMLPSSPLRALPATAVTRRSRDPGHIPKNLFGPAVSAPAPAPAALTTTLPAVVQDVPALAAGACQDDCSGHGTCFQGACSCMNGWSGELCEMEPCPNDCTGRGTCLPGGCLCNAQFYGAACEFSRCLDDCSGNGYCNQGVCQCDPGFQGVACKEGLRVRQVVKGISIVPHAKPSNLRSALSGYRGALGPKACPDNCNGNGRCDPDTGVCTCYKGYSGDACQNFCPNDCSGQGRCLNGVCICLFGHGGIDCGIKTCCSGHGDCTIPGTCVCNPGWLGDQCAVAMTCADPDCSGHGSCESGLCQCEPGFSGDTCAEAPSECGGPCPAGGTCDRGSGTCMCGAAPCPEDTKGKGKGSGGNDVAPPSGRSSVVPAGKSSGFASPDGEPGAGGEGDANATAAEDWGLKDESSAKTIDLYPACNKPHGEWNDTISQCVCDTAGKWYGSNCENQHCADWDEETGKPDCTGHGSCVKGECFCSAGWGQETGKAGPNLCSDPMCPIDCGDHGICQLNACICQEGWTGPACREPKCMDDCSGHGTCSFVAPNAPAECNCEYGYTGADCSKEALYEKLETCPNECSGRGLCMAGRCVCQEGSMGIDCSERWCPPGSTGPNCELQSCPRDCSGAGLCMNGVCTCDDDHLGDDCSIPLVCYDACAQYCVKNSVSEECENCKGECMTLQSHPVIGKAHPLLTRVLTLLGVGDHRSRTRGPAGKERQPRFRRRHKETSTMQRGQFWSHAHAVSQSVE